MNILNIKVSCLCITFKTYFKILFVLGILHKYNLCFSTLLYCIFEFQYYDLRDTIFLNNIFQLLILILSIQAWGIKMDYKKMTSNEYCETIIKRINTIMEQKNLKQLDLVSQSNISQSSLSKILKGEMRLTLQHIFKICNALDISPEELFSLDKNICDISHEENNNSYDETGLFNEQYMNEQVLIRDTNHPVFNGFINNTFYMYLYSTITSESFLLDGEISFEKSAGSSFCKASMILNTGKIDTDGKIIKKYYSGELIVSLTMGACYCVLVNADIGEICFLNFKHMFLFNRELECRVGTISSTSSGGNRLPVIQRILISKKPLKVSGNDLSDMEFVQGQLRLNNSKMLVSVKDLAALRKKYVNNPELLDFFQKFEEISTLEQYLLLDESSMKDISITSDVKTEGLGILRNISSSLRYNKVSTKTDEFVFEYICNKTNEK